MKKRYEQYEDTVLVELLINDDENAFIEIYNRYWEKLYNVACNKLNEYYLAQEIVQNIFISIWERRKNIEFKTSLNIYLAAALKYQVINARQKMGREKNYTNYILNNLQNDDNATENMVSFKALQERLSSVVAELPAQCQLVYKLKREHGLTSKEISEKLGITEKAVESNLTRALKKIKTILSDFNHSFLQHILHRNFIKS